MNLQKYTEKAQQAVLAAKEMAEEANNNQIEPVHLLTALIEQPEGVVPQVLSRLGVDTATLLQKLHAELDKQPKVYGGGGQSYISSTLNEVTRNAENIAASIKDEYVSTEHLLLALADDSDKSPAGKFLREAGVSKEKILGVSAQ